MKIKSLNFLLLLITVIISSQSVAQSNLAKLEKVNRNLVHELLTKYTSNENIKPKEEDSIKKLKYINNVSFEYTKTSSTHSLTYLFNLKTGSIEYTYTSNNKLINIGELYFSKDSFAGFNLEKFDDMILNKNNKSSCGGLSSLVGSIMDAIEEAIASGNAQDSDTVQDLISALIYALMDTIECMVQ